MEFKVMRKVLFIAYQFPPCKEVGGSIRSEKFANFLKRFGWHPLIVALDSECTVNHAESVSSITRLKTLLPFSKPYELAPYGWAMNVWKKYRERKDFDVIYISCPPFPQIIAGVFIKKKSGAPLVLDLRDAWSLDPYKEGSRFKKIVYKYVFPRVERWAFFNADKIIMNTPSMLSAYKKLYPMLSSRLVLIPNGYDESDFLERGCTKGVPKEEYMELLYCGRFGVGGRDPKLILEAIKLLKNTLKIKLIIYGEQPLGVLEKIKLMGLESKVTLKGQLEHSEVIKRMFETDVLLAYQENSNEGVQAVSGKTYEYLRVGKPILSIAPTGDNQNLIQQYAARYEIVTEYEVNVVVSAIKSLYADWLHGNLLSNKVKNLDYSDKYERKELTKQLSKVLTEAVGIA
jgi:glycosyltransferase involved in cell wall biosynthesis